MIKLMGIKVSVKGVKGQMVYNKMMIAIKMMIDTMPLSITVRMIVR